MRAFSLILVPALAGSILLGGCGSPVGVHTDHDPAADFTALRTWAWSPRRSLTPGTPDAANPLLQARLDQAVERELAAKGFRKADAKSADFIVGYAGAVNRELRTRVIDDHYHYPRYRWYDYPFYYGPARRDVIITEYERGTLVLDVVERASRKLVWRGTARATLPENPTPERSAARINQAVKQLLAGFPPKGG